MTTRTLIVEVVGDNALQRTKEKLDEKDLNGDVSEVSVEVTVTKGDDDTETDGDADDDAPDPERTPADSKPDHASTTTRMGKPRSKEQLSEPGSAGHRVLQYLNDGGAEDSNVVKEQVDGAVNTVGGALSHLYKGRMVEREPIEDRYVYRITDHGRNVLDDLNNKQES